MLFLITWDGNFFYGSKKGHLYRGSTVVTLNIGTYYLRDRAFPIDSDCKQLEIEIDDGY